MVDTRRALLGLAATALLLGGCGRLGDEDARRLVQSYVTRVAEAYRAGDAELTDPVASDRLVRRLTGLIGVKHDNNMVMESEVLELQFLSVERPGKAVVVETRERWRYRDREIGTGRQIGEESTDAYHVRYHLARESGKWVVDQIEFAEPPVVGRKAAPMVTDTRVLHGLPPKDEGAETR